jgi:hypothetical protein
VVVPTFLNVVMSTAMALSHLLAWILSLGLFLNSRPFIVDWPVVIFVLILIIIVRHLKVIIVIIVPVVFWVLQVYRIEYEQDPQ